MLEALLWYWLLDYLLGGLYRFAFDTGQRTHVSSAAPGASWVTFTEDHVYWLSEDEKLMRAVK